MKARIDDKGVFINAYRDDYNFPDTWILVDITNEELNLICELVKCKKIDNNWIKIESTPEEIAEANKPIVPQTISAMRLKLQLFDMGITDQDIFDDIDSIPEVMFSTADKEKAKIMYKTATSFERTDGKLNLVATMEGLTQKQLDDIFINGNSL